jgi:hypothetical protein
VRRTTFFLAIVTLIIRVMLSVSLNLSNVIDVANTYGPSYVAGNIIGEFLIILLVHWIIEKNYDKIRPRAKTLPPTKQALRMTINTNKQKIAKGFLRVSGLAFPTHLFIHKILPKIGIA